jgi:hypothetical protein
MFVSLSGMPDRDYRRKAECVLLGLPGAAEADSAAALSRLWQ